MVWVDVNVDAIADGIDQIGVLDIAELARSFGVVVGHAMFGERGVVQVVHQVRRLLRLFTQLRREQVVDGALRLVAVESSACAIR